MSLELPVLKAPIMHSRYMLPLHSDESIRYHVLGLDYFRSFNDTQLRSFSLEKLFSVIG